MATFRCAKEPATVSSRSLTDHPSDPLDPESHGSGDLGGSVTRSHLATSSGRIDYDSPLRRGSGRSPHGPAASRGTAWQQLSRIATAGFG